MQRIFNMLIQNLTNMGNSITKVNYWDDYINVEFAKGEEKFVVTIRIDEEDNKNGN